MKDGWGGQSPAANPHIQVIFILEITEKCEELSPVVFTMHQKLSLIAMGKETPPPPGILPPPFRICRSGKDQI